MIAEDKILIVNLEPYIERYVDINFLDREQALKIQSAFFSNMRIQSVLQEDKIYELAKNQKITINDVAECQYDALEELCENELIFEQVKNGQLTLGIANCPYMQFYIDNKLLTIRQINNQKHLFDHEAREYNDKRSKIHECYRIENLKTLLRHSPDLMFDVSRLLWGQSRLAVFHALTDENIFNKIAQETITLELAYVTQKYVDVNPQILTAEQAGQLTSIQMKYLETERIVHLIENGIITVDEAIQLREAQYELLVKNDHAYNFFLNGELTLAALEDDNIQQIHHIAQVNQIEPDQLNYAQSAHNASVHESVSLSVKKLYSRYGHKIEENHNSKDKLSEVNNDDTKLEEVIKRFEMYITENMEDLRTNCEKLYADLQEGAGKDNFLDQPKVSHLTKLLDFYEKCETGLRGFQRVTAANYKYTDKGSQISTRQLLALFFLAISDEANCELAGDKIFELIIDTLYEAQCGYNLDAKGVHDGGDDSPVCTGGTLKEHTKCDAPRVAAGPGVEPSRRNTRQPTRR
ncbi:MAG: hypothetical protein HKM04_10205 [Legionellales bacterium]|nr:hypothetical protein [Legionellales bacterium]